MSNEYRDLLGLPYARSSVLTGFLARMPMAMLGVAFILLVTATYGSYALAGALSGSLLLTQSLTASYRGRLADRWGQRRAVLPLVVTHTACLAGILVCCLVRGPIPLLLAFGLLSGAVFPQIGALVRARWTERLPLVASEGMPALATALSLESAVDEIVYIVGPVVATAAAGLIGSSAGLAAAMLCTFVGGILFLTRPGGGRPKPAAGGRSRSLMRIGGMPVLAVICVALGTVLGSVEVISVAFAREHGSTLLAGPLVASFSVGSLASGLVYGSRTWRRPPAFRFVMASACLFLGTVPIVLAPSVGLLAAAAALAGLAVSPTLIGAHELIQAKVPPANINEGFSWIQTTLGLGLGVGVVLAGVVTENTDAHTAFLVSAGAGAAAMVLAVLFRWALGRTPDAPATPVPAVGTTSSPVLADGGSGFHATPTEPLSAGQTARR